MTECVCVCALTCLLTYTVTVYCVKGSQGLFTAIRKRGLCGHSSTKVCSFSFSSKCSCQHCWCGNVSRICLFVARVMSSIFSRCLLSCPSCPIGLNLPTETFLSTTNLFDGVVVVVFLNYYKSIMSVCVRFLHTIDRVWHYLGEYCVSLEDRYIYKMIDCNKCNWIVRKEIDR